jgi:hypothetical protein
MLIGGRKVEARISYPAGKLFRDEELGDFKIYEGNVTIGAMVRRGDAQGPVSVQIKFQTCNKNTCLTPATITVTTR